MKKFLTLLAALLVVFAFTINAKASAGSFETSDSDAAINLGGGLDYYVTDQFSLGLDGKYVGGTGDLEAIEYFVGTINAAFHF